MTARPLSRRDTLRHAFRFSSALAVAALVGCDAQASTERPPTSTATPQEADAASTPSRTATPASTPALPSTWRLDLVPTRLMMWRVGIDAPVGLAETVIGAGGHPEIEVPESGVVTPNPSLGERSINNVWIVGHSRWHRVPQLLYTLPLAEIGDRIEIEGVDGASGSALPRLAFEVESLVIADTETTARRVYGATPALPRVIVQTSARQTYDPEWILDRELVLPKSEVDLAGPIDDLSRYLLMLVVGRITDAALAELVAG
ncbi:MAG: hypothetical protein AB7I38_03090 [Dehalococcoidia bacterium]